MLEYKRQINLNRILFLLFIFLGSCTGLEGVLIGLGSNVVSEIIINNVDKINIGESEMNVKIVKLVSGEELIGEFNEKKHIINNPVVMIPVNNEKIAFSPWMPYAEDKEFLLKTEQIILVANPSKIITNEYNRAFGSGIVVP